MNAGTGGREGRLYTDSNRETCRINTTSYNRTKLVYDPLSFIYTFHTRVSLLAVERYTKTKSLFKEQSKLHELFLTFLIEMKIVHVLNL